MNASKGKYGDHKTLLVAFEMASTINTPNARSISMDSNLVIRLGQQFLHHGADHFTICLPGELFAGNAHTFRRSAGEEAPVSVIILRGSL